MEDGHAKTSEEVLKFFGTNEELGLTPEQVKSYQAKYGPNGECCKKKIIASNFFILCQCYKERKTKMHKKMRTQQSC